MTAAAFLVVDHNCRADAAMVTTIVVDCTATTVAAVIRVVVIC